MTDPNEPTPTEPTQRHQVVASADCVRYTDPSQFSWFEQRIMEGFANPDINLRFDEDGTTLRWFGYYVLPLGSWLIQGYTVISDEELRADVPNAWKPLPEWPAAEPTDPSTS